MGAHVSTIAELAALVARQPGLYLRYSAGPEQDAASTSMDYESGLELPGLAVNPLEPEPWWTRPAEEWLARKLCNYVHLHEESGGDRRAWVLRGREVGRGPDNEPLVRLTDVVATIDDSVLGEAKALYRRAFDVGRESTSTTGSTRGGRPAPSTA